MNVFQPLGTLRRLAHALFLRARHWLPAQRSCAFGPNPDKVAQVYVINLDRQPGRLAAVRRELSRIMDADARPLSGRLERHAACDGRSMSAEARMGPDVHPHYTLADQLFVEPQPDAWPANFDLTRPIRMTAAEVAVAQSHIDVWRRIAGSEATYALVLEDDVWFERGFGSLVDAAWEEMTAAEGGPPSFDVLYLSYKEVKHGAPKVALSKHVFRPERGLWYLSGYVLSRRGAENLLARLPCKGPVDLWINQQFHAMDVRAVRTSVISQRSDLTSTNAYSVLPALAQIGVLNDDTPGMFHQRPTHAPVFAFCSPGAGSSSLAIALSMLGYRCCSNVDDLPKMERDRLMRGRGRRVFDAYVNVAFLAPHAAALRQRYPQAKFIVFGTPVRDAGVAALLGSDDGAVLHLPLGADGSWNALCEHLRLPPPVAAYPACAERGTRVLRRASTVRDAVPAGTALRHDRSPWIAPPNRGWPGLDVEPVAPPDRAAIERIQFEDELATLDADRWFCRDDTFPGNLALFRPSNVTPVATGGMDLGVAEAALGVRDLAAAALSSRDRFRYGHFEATLQSTNVPGLVTGFFLHRDSPRQEIDVEITGDRPDRLLVNVFYNPGPEEARFDYGYRGTPVSIPLGFDASEHPHTYRIEWKPDEIRWLVDGRVVHRRVLWDPTPIPDLPMTLHVNTWPTRSHELAGALDQTRLPARARVVRIRVDALTGRAGTDVVTGRPHAPRQVAPLSA